MDPVGGSLCGVILAAGASSRLGEPKALARIGKNRVIDRIRSTLAQVLDEATPAKPSVMVVTGAHHEEIQRHLTALKAAEEVLFNRRWASGRTGSVQAAALARPGRALLIWPADVPLVAQATLLRLVSEWNALGQPAEGWLAPQDTASGSFGHPIIMGASLALWSLQLAASDPLRAVRAHATALHAVAVNDPSILDDLDTPSDLAKLRSRVQ
ncbi:MAG: NTP transferase domain-containing protein [Planctomycetota bacterium]